MKLDKIILLFLSIFIIAFFNEHLTSLKAIGITGALLITIYNIFINKNIILNNIFSIFHSNKVILILMFVFLFSFIISSCFAYTDSLHSLNRFFREIKYPLLFGFIIFSIMLPKNKLIKHIVISFVLSTIILNLYFLFKDFNYNAIVNHTFTIDRFYAQFLDVLFPFSVVLFLTTKSKILKLIIFIFSILLSIVLLLYTGARGSWLTIFVEFTIILTYLLIKNRSLLYKYKNYLIFGSITVILTIFFTYNYSNIIKRKINQGSYTSGRDYILKDRLPIFMASNKKVLGLGYGGHNYIQFMNDNSAPKRVGKWTKDKKLFLYNHDDPYLVAVFYQFGTLGLISIIIFLIYFISTNLKQFYKLNYKDEILYQVAIFSSFFSLIFVRGLFENIYLKYIIILFFIYILTNSYNKENNENSLHIS